MDKKYILHFYKISLFGKCDDDIASAVSRAYRDMCRTIRFKEQASHTDEYSSVVNFFKDSLSTLSGINSQKSYDEWHDNACLSIIDIYKGITRSDAPFSYGQAQKWLNMFMKYLIILESPQIEPIEKFLHIPVDNIIINAAGIGSPGCCWSKINREQYIQFQNRLKAIVPASETPIEWEFHTWSDNNH